MTKRIFMLHTGKGWLCKRKSHDYFEEKWVNKHSMMFHSLTNIKRYKARLQKVSGFKLKIKEVLISLTSLEVKNE